MTPLPKKTWEKFLEFIGCKLKHIKGDHYIYDRPGLKRPVVHTNDKEISVALIMSNLKTLGINRDDFFEIMKKI